MKEYVYLQGFYDLGKRQEICLQRLLISRFQVRVLGGSLGKTPQAVGFSLFSRGSSPPSTRLLTSTAFPKTLEDIEARAGGRC